MSVLTELNTRIESCTDCALSGGRTRAVPGEGPENAEVMFIGEGPGFHEDREGRPFVGPAGKLLDDLLSLAGLRRPDVFIANVIKCRPPGNRDPLPNEIEACAKYLTRQLDIIRPRVIVTLGRYSMARFFPGQTIGRIHGRPQTIAGVTYMPMYHPAAALRQQSLRQVLEADFAGLKEIIDRALSSETAAEPAPQAEQLRLM